MNTILFCGSSSVGKTSVILGLLELIDKDKACVCKIDCVGTDDDKKYKNIGVSAICALSMDICPDHFLVSNIVEINNWAKDNNKDLIFIETAGLCHRCSPATKSMLSVCVISAMDSMHSPKAQGPMLNLADFIIITKTDMISQAELEILIWQVEKLNTAAKIFSLDCLAGYGFNNLKRWLLKTIEKKSDTVYEDYDLLRHTMPCGVCSYCVGEKRIGEEFQQGVIAKINF